MTFVYQNIECGNIFDCTEQGIAEMFEEARELYDWGDPTNDISITEYYKLIRVD